MGFRILGLSPAPFQSLFGLPDEALAERGARRTIADKAVGFPDRIEVRDAAPGESLLLINFVHQPAHTPYYASHAIFIREGAAERLDVADTVPDALRIRPISLRAFDATHMMVAADLSDGRVLEAAIERLLDQQHVSYIQAHFAVRGCYACRIERAR
jgi:hypothetical protein